MLLNADLVFSELKKLHAVEITGPRSSDLRLSRPEFYMDGDTVFRSHHLYVATVDHLPKRPRIEKNAVLVCIGSAPVLNSYKDRLCLITVKNRIDFFKIFHEIQSVFDAYESWERAMYEDLFEGEDIQKLVSDANAAFKKPMFVLDRSFNLVASSGITSETARRFRGNAGSLGLESISGYLADANPMLDERRPMRIDVPGNMVLCTNLFNENDEYEGCLCVYAAGDQFSEGDEVLSAHFARILQYAIKNNAAIINSDVTSRKSLMQTLLEEMPLTSSQHFLLDASNGQNNFVCVSLQSYSSADQLPSSYLCNAFETAFSNSYAIAHNDSVVCFVETDALKDGKTDSFTETLTAQLRDFVSHMRLNAGVSNEFNNLFDIRFHYAQAESAIENGLLVSPEQHVFHFENYALIEMVMNALGGQPVQFYYPKGLKKIREHDEKAGVSYLETLSVFLEEGMSYSAAASQLCIHRSTLVDRISRITRDYEIDLDDPDQRLQLEMLLKAAEIEKIFHQ